MKYLLIITLSILLSSCYDHEAEKKRIEDLEFHTQQLQNENGIKEKERELYYQKKLNRADSINSLKRK